MEVGGEQLAPSAVSVFVRAGDKTLIATDLGHVDVLQGLPQVPRYAELEAEAHDADLDGLVIRVCSLEHLLAMKRAADRPTDRLGIVALEGAHREQGSNG